jgi:hypothetical protein
MTAVSRKKSTTRIQTGANKPEENHGIIPMANRSQPTVQEMKKRKEKPTEKNPLKQTPLP